MTLARNCRSGGRSFLWQCTLSEAVVSLEKCTPQTAKEKRIMTGHAFKLGWTGKGYIAEKEYVGGHDIREIRMKEGERGKVYAATLIWFPY